MKIPKRESGDSSLLRFASSDIDIDIHHLKNDDAYVLYTVERKKTREQKEAEKE